MSITAGVSSWRSTMARWTRFWNSPGPGSPVRRLRSASRHRRSISSTCGLHMTNTRPAVPVAPRRTSISRCERSPGTRQSNTSWPPSAMIRRNRTPNRGRASSSSSIASARRWTISSRMSPHSGRSRSHASLHVTTVPSLPTTAAGVPIATTRSARLLGSSSTPVLAFLPPKCPGPYPSTSGRITTRRAIRVDFLTSRED